MQKIISLYQRNYGGDRLVRDEVVPGAEWVLAGEGVPTRKFDGTPCMIRDGKQFKRFDAKNGKTPPDGFEPTQEPDPVTGHWPGWVPVTDGPEDKLFREGLATYIDHEGDAPADGTYELVGPKVNRNAEGFISHELVRHGDEVLAEPPRDFVGLRDYLGAADIEGIVWHHPDGRMVKIKTRDFGLKRGPAAGGRP